MKTMRTRSVPVPVLLAISIASASGAVVADPAPADAAVKSCCESLASLPAAAPWSNEQKLSLLPQSPHFDFGQGLAPFVHLALSPATVAIELRTHRMGVWTPSYADLRLVFLDANREPLPGVTIFPPKLEASSRMIVANIAVPLNAASMLVTSHPGTAGQQETASIRTGDSAVVVSRMVIPLPGGMATVKYQLSPYGNVTVVSHP